MPFQIIRGNVAHLETEAIVRETKIGQASGENTQSGRIVIEAQLPDDKADKQAVLEALGASYERALSQAAQTGCETIAIPLLGTAIPKLSKNELLRVAVEQITEWLEASELQIFLVIENVRQYRVPQPWTEGLDAYIEENLVKPGKGPRLPFPETLGQLMLRNVARELGVKEDNYEDLRRRLTQELLDMKAWWEEPFSDEDDALVYKLQSALAEASGRMDHWMDPWSNLRFREEPGKPLDSWLESTAKSFRQMLTEYMWEKNLSAQEVYKRSNLDRRLFSKLTSSEGYHPNKRTCMALCIGMRLDIDESRMLLERAGWAFNPSKRMDIIVRYAIENGMYDIDHLNAVLYKYHEEQLGSGWRVPRELQD